jgi:hypothetical protein
MLFSHPNSVNALRCGSDLISERDRKYEVLSKCGEPEFIEKWEEEKAVYVTNAKHKIIGDLLLDRQNILAKSRISHIEEWTYNFGPYKFIQYLTFVNGKLKKIEDGPKGFKGDIFSGTYKSRCGHLVETGDRKIEVIMNCGDPVSIEYTWEEYISTVSARERIRKIPRFFRNKQRRPKKRDFKFVKEIIYEQKRSVINIEEWTYNFGPRRFLYFITLENGKVVRVEEGGYGF